MREEIVQKVREAISQNKTYVAFPAQFIDELKKTFGQEAVFEYSSQGKKYAILNLFKAKLPKEENEKNEKVLNGVKVIFPNYEDYLLTGQRQLKYVQQFNELKVLRVCFESEQNVLLVGPKGTGKTLCLAYFAKQSNLPIIQFDCSENTKRYDLIGYYTKIGNEVVFQLGELPKAIVVANQAYQNGYEGAVLVLEEINALNPQMQKILNQLLDWRRGVYVPEIGRRFVLEKGAKLLVAGTMNPSYYSGVFDLNEDLRSRFVEFYFPYPRKEKEIEIIKANLNGKDIDDELLEKLTTLAQETRAGYENGTYSYCLSPRDLVNFVKLYVAFRENGYDEIRALRMTLNMVLLNRFDPVQSRQERETLKLRIQEIFGIEV